MKEKAKRLSKKVIFIIVCAAIIGTFFIAYLGLQIAFLIADKIECWRPDYEKIDLSEILSKDELDDDDYEVLFAQTGLTRLGIDRMLAHGIGGVARILSLQADYFAEHEIINELYTPLICTDYMNDIITHVYLENGDVIVTSSTHVSGWRIGHSGLVTNASKMYNREEVLQASAYGETSAVGTIIDFTDRVNFMIFSPKADEQTKAEVVDYALNNLIGLTYDVTAGVLTSKNKVERTQCAHLVWYAYNKFGIDLDSNGGRVVTPKNLANSPEMELVQVFGFDPDTLWN